MNLDELAPYLDRCPYPSQLTCVDRGIQGRGFYPAATGFHNGSDPLGGIMLLGRDWGTEVQYSRWKGAPSKDETALTWRHTRDTYLPILEGIPVWCTNYLLGVRRDGSAMDNLHNKCDPEPWAKFEEYCWKFLQRQVLLQCPTLVMILGQPNRDDLERTGRLGIHAEEIFHHSFQSDSARHVTSVTYADHPHSLLNPVNRKRTESKLKTVSSLYHHDHYKPS